GPETEMKRSRFSEEQIIGILKDQEAGITPTADILPEARDIQRDILQVEGEVRGLGISDAKRLKALEDENAKLKKPLPQTMLDNAILKDINSRKWWLT